MNNSELIDRIMQKKEFSKLPHEDVVLAFEKFDKPRNSEYQKLKLTRNFLRGIYSSFSSRKLLSVSKTKEADWYLIKHKSTKERYDYYKEIYGRIFRDIKKGSVVDLGAGVNGFSYQFFKNLGLEVDYVAVEAVGQLVELMNKFFSENKINGEAFHLSVFEIDKLKDLIKKQQNPKIIFLFEIIDSIEALKRDYSKDLIIEVSKLSKRIALSFATKSLGKRKKFHANRNWILKFIRENFNILDDFELNGERYIVFEN